MYEDCSSGPCQVVSKNNFQRLRSNENHQAFEENMFWVFLDQIWNGEDFLKGYQRFARPGWKSWGSKVCAATSEMAKVFHEKMPSAARLVKRLQVQYVMFQKSWPGGIKSIISWWGADEWDLPIRFLLHFAAIGLSQILLAKYQKSFSLNLFESSLYSCFYRLGLDMAKTLAD
jgi:hypothetical protein